jgi:hypothetical protein
MTARTTLLSALVGSLSFGAALPVHAQNVTRAVGDVRAVEAFTHIGRFRAGSDEGSIGHGASYGATVTVPLRGPVALDLDVQTSEVSSTRGRPSDTYTTRRTLLIPSVLYRFGLDRVYGYVGGGIGAEFEASTYRQDVGAGLGRPQRGWQEVDPGVFELHQSETGRSVSFRSGFAAFPMRRLGLRGDVLVASWHLAARMGVGYRF